MVQQNNHANLEQDPSIKFGKFLTHAPPGEEIVISGMSGNFPLSDDIEEFKYNLDNKIEMITQMPKVHPELPTGLGSLKDCTGFDTGFFGIHKQHALTLSPYCKMLLEKCYECIFDAGLHPADLEGSNTGVFLGVCFCESEIHWYLRDNVKGGNAILGNEKALFANRISHHLKLKGPSFIVDTACSSSAYALEAAYKAIRTGECDSAIVGGSNIALAGGCSLQFARLGVLSPDGHCRPFDVDGSGYVRSEANVAILLQKAQDSKRIYATILHTKTNCDGYKEQGITYPSGTAQYNLLTEIYLESGIKPCDMSYIEAHGTGTVVGDPEELKSVDEFFTPGRHSPLLIGSVKSSIGHSEPVSALCSIVKVILALETNVISPNINYKTARKNIPGIWQGRLEVVVENTPFRDERGLVGVSSFGFGGGNSHVVLKKYSKQKIGKGEPRDDLPRLVCASGRTAEAIEILFKDVADKFDAEHIALLHNIFRKSINNHIYRGYLLITHAGIVKKSIQLFNASKNNFCIQFGDLSKTTERLLHELLTLPLLLNFGKRLSDFFIKNKLDINSIIASSLQVNSTQLLIDLLAQLTFAELLKQLEVTCQILPAYSYGRLASAYYENSINLDQCLECIYAIVNISSDIEVSKNGNGINAEDLKKYKLKLLAEFEKIFTSAKQVNGCNGTHIQVPLTEYFLEGIFSRTQSEISTLNRHSVLLEIGQPRGLKTRCSTVINLQDQSDLLDILEIIGSMYQYGFQPQIQKLYPKVDFPVSRGTPIISSKIKWNHDLKHFVPSFDYTWQKTDALVFKIALSEEEWASMDGHVIDGRNLFPATGYLYLAWTVLAEVLARDLTKAKVVFENCKFRRACSLFKASSTNYLELKVMVQRLSGNFEIVEGDVPVVTGRIRVCDSPVNLVYSNAINEKDSIKENILNTMDIYKELRLRGYNYRGVFKSLTECNQSATHGKIKWLNNWVAFMDNMLQMKILGEDTRLLFVPTAIAMLTVDPESHLKEVELLRNGNEGKDIEMPVEVNYKSGVIRSGGIEIRGLLAASIPRKKNTAFPVLEKYQFVPNEGKIPLDQAVRVFMQLALDNNCGFKMKAVEVIDEATEKDAMPLVLLIRDVLGDYPLVQVDVTVLCAEKIELDVNVENKKLAGENECTVVVGSKMLSRNLILQDALKATQEEGFLISRESISVDLSNIDTEKLQVLSIFETTEEKLILLRKKKCNVVTKPRVFVNVDAKIGQFAWLNNLQEAIKIKQDVIVWSQTQSPSGILGLVKCARREPGCEHVRCLFIIDAAPAFDPENPFYKTQLDKNLGINVYMNKSWGTYVHLLLDNTEEIESQHCYANTTVRGDLSSIKWIEGPLSSKTQTKPGESLVEVYYSSLNFRDIMTASGRLNADVITKDRREQECVQGFEFSGKTLNGKRVMGMLSQGTLATLVKADNLLLWDVPKIWTLKDAATVPVVYGTCLYALVVVGKMKPSDSVLIHSGTGGIGQAAINLCLNMGCTVFTTVGTEEKRKYIRRHFPQIDENHIGNSRDTTFEQIVMKRTNGKGVDIILNSLSEEKLCASARCLAKNGRFLEIGKFDLSNDNNLSLLSFKEGGSFHGVMLDRLFNETEETKKKLNLLVKKFIDSGAVKPLSPTVFEMQEVEQAFRFMTTGKHMGKVLVEIRNEDTNQHIEKFKALSRYFCDPSKTYIICGGLGGFGLELADWLVLRGAKNLLLTSRRGITKGYQNYRISIWKSYSCNIKVSTQDITTKRGCENLIKEANSLAPVAAVFNLAVVLCDAILPNQNEENFKASLEPKAYATQYLDEVTRVMCPDLRSFVVFSSVACGRGNAGQCNYGMSNSVMEMICEKRRKDGFAALAIQWGAIGEVGLVADMQEKDVEVVILGTLQQSISSCLQLMDVFLRQNEAAVVASMVVAEKKSSALSGSIMQVVGGILGIRDIKSVSIHSTLAELGMDSMTGVEVKQVLEREYNIFLSPTEIRSITLARIKEMQEEGIFELQEWQPANEEIDWTVLLKNLVESEEQKLPIIKLRTLNSTKNQETLPLIIAFPGIEGVCQILQNLTEMLEVRAYGVNYISNTQEDSISDMAVAILPHIKKLLQPERPFHIFAHSVGSNVAMEVVSELEKLGYKGFITFLDGSPVFLKRLATGMAGEDFKSETMENNVLASTLRIQLNDVDTAKVMNEIRKCSTLEEKFKIYLASIKTDEHLTESFYKNGIIATIKRIKACYFYKPNFGKLKSKASLIKPTTISVQMEAKDYELSQYFEEPIEIEIFDGTHTTLLKNKNLAEAIMKNLDVLNEYTEN